MKPHIIIIVASLLLICLAFVNMGINLSNSDKIDRNFSTTQNLWRTLKANNPQLKIQEPSP